jgi:cobalamin synthase
MNGALREFGFKRIMGDETAGVLSVVTGILVILGTTYALFRIPRDAATGRLVVQSATLVVLTVCYEFAIGLRGGQSFSALLEHYAFWRGELWPLVLAALAATPFLWRGRR